MSIPGKQFDRLDNLEELTNSIDMGSDIEFNLYGIRYNISTDGTPFIAACPDGDGIHYQNAADMAEHHLINGVPLKDTWKDIEILFM